MVRWKPFLDLTLNDPGCQVMRHIVTLKLEHRTFIVPIVDYKTSWVYWHLCFSDARSLSADSTTVSAWGCGNSTTWFQLKTGFKHLSVEYTALADKASTEVRSSFFKKTTENQYLFPMMSGILPLSGRMPDSQSREPGFESLLLLFRNLGIFIL